MAVKMTTACMATLISVMIAQLQSSVPANSGINAPSSSRQPRAVADISGDGVKDDSHDIGSQRDLENDDLQEPDDLEQETSQNVTLPAAAAAVAEHRF